MFKIFKYPPHQNIFENITDHPRPEQFWKKIKKCSQEITPGPKKFGKNLKISKEYHLTRKYFENFSKFHPFPKNVGKKFQKFSKNHPRLEIFLKIYLTNCFKISPLARKFLEKNFQNLHLISFSLFWCGTFLSKC